MRSHIADLGRKMRAAVALMAAKDATASAGPSRVLDDAASADAAGLSLSSDAVRTKAFADAKEAIVASPASARQRTVAAKERRAAVQVEAMEKERMVRPNLLPLPLHLLLLSLLRHPAQDCSGFKTLSHVSLASINYDTLAISTPGSMFEALEAGIPRPSAIDGSYINFP
jgi:hypothetical protein